MQREYDLARRRGGLHWLQTIIFTLLIHACKEWVMLMILYHIPAGSDPGSQTRMPGKRDVGCLKLRRSHRIGLGEEILLSCFTKLGI